MNAFFVLWRKELSGYFSSPIAYVVSIFFLAVMGYIFWLLAAALAQGPAGVTVMNVLFGSPFFWMIMLVIVPVLTMRLLAEEKRSGTMETLLTAPVRDTQVVLAKYAGAMSFYVVMWIPTAAYVYVLREFSSIMAPIDLGPMLGGYVGALLIGAFYIAIGLFCSSLTGNQIVAAIICFALISLAFFSGFLEIVSRVEAVRHIGAYISSYSHMLEFSRGIMDSRPVVFYLTGTALMLYATVKVVESRKWK